MRANEIQWHFPEEFDGMVIRMGGFHIALNYLAVIGKTFEDSGVSRHFSSPQRKILQSRCAGSQDCCRSNAKAAMARVQQVAHSKEHHQAR